jgi:hypothetical protein
MNHIILEGDTAIELDAPVHDVLMAGLFAAENTTGNPLDWRMIHVPVYVSRSNLDMHAIQEHIGGGLFAVHIC